MFNNVAIDVVIGLIFVYLLYSLLAAIIQEALAHWLQLRPKILIRSISVMLDEVDHTPAKTSARKCGAIFCNRLKSIFRNPFEVNKWPITIEFYKQPSIQFLKESDSSIGPSYISSSIFSETLLRMLRGDVVSVTADPMINIREAVEKNGLKLDKDTAALLKHMLAESNADLARFKDKIESWYNETQDRATGWYKKQTQLILFLLGLLLAWGNNIDSIKIAKILSTNPVAREQVVQMATELQKQKTMQSVGGKDSLSQSDKKAIASQAGYLKDMAAKAQQVMGLGWKDHPMDLNPCHKGWCKRVCIFFLFVPGWLITAAMISLGAPFWFDMLNKMMQLRGSVKEDGTPNTAVSATTAAGGAVPASMRKG